MSRNPRLEEQVSFMLSNTKRELTNEEIAKVTMMITVNRSLHVQLNRQPKAVF